MIKPVKNQPKLHISDLQNLPSSLKLNKMKTELPNKEEAINMLSVRASISTGKWKAVKNKSWGEEHKKAFGDNEGFVICVKNRHSELVAIASVYCGFGENKNELPANAKLIAAAPALLEALEKFTLLDENHYRDIAGLIQHAKNVIKELS